MAKYTSLEKAMLGVRTDKEVEECHKRRAESDKASIEKSRHEKEIILYRNGKKSIVSIHEDRNPHNYTNVNAPGWEYIGTYEKNTSGHYMPYSERKIVMEV